MVKIKDIGEFKKVPQIVTDLIASNLAALEEYFKENGIDKEIKIGSYIYETPLDIALIMENFESVKWLVEHGANLNIKDNPCFVTAVRYCSENIIRYLAQNGAAVNSVNHVKTDAFGAALHGKRIENLPIIHELGHTVQKYGGNAFGAAVSGRNYKAMEFFIKNGVDINYYIDMVYPYKIAPLCVAARYVDLAMCKYLVEHGADVTIADKTGMRPYHIAVEKDDLEMAEYFKSLEPAKFHSIQNKLDKLKPYKLPTALLDFLQGEHLHIELESCDFGFIDFFKLIDTIPMKIGRQKLLRISKASGDYNHIMLVWNPKTKNIAYYDMEHEELGDMCSFEEFMKEPMLYMEKIFDGEYCEQ